jgi:hypothetical protein
MYSLNDTSNARVPIQIVHVRFQNDEFAGSSDSQKAREFASSKVAPADTVLGR